MPVGAGRERGSDFHRSLYYLKAQPPAHAVDKTGFNVAGLRARHQSRGFFLQHLFALVGATVEYHLIKCHHIGCRGVEAAGGVGCTLAVGEAALEKVHFHWLQFAF